MFPSRRERVGGMVLKISELKSGMKRVNVSGKVVEKSEAREVFSRYRGTVFRVATAVIADDSGSIKLTLWNDQIERVNVDDFVEIENGYVTTFRGEIQLNVGKYGKLSVS